MGVGPIQVHNCDFISSIQTFTGTMKGVSEQQSVIEKIKDAAGQEYPHLHHL